MNITVPILVGAALKIHDLAENGLTYPTARLQKGLVLVKNDQELVEEAVGFGVPLLKRGNQTIFPGGVELIDQQSGRSVNVIARFTLNLEEKLGQPGQRGIKNNRLYAVKNSLAALIRRRPKSREPLTLASNALRRLFNWETKFEEANFNAEVQMCYTFVPNSGRIIIELDAGDLSRDGVTEIVIMNEQGAHHFDQYRDASGAVLRRSEISCWDEVTTDWASFVSEKDRLAFTLWQLDSAKLFRGRELIGSRLAWSGFGYSIPPAIKTIRYELMIDEL